MRAKVQNDPTFVSDCRRFTFAMYIYIYFFFVKHPQQFSAAQKNHLISSIYVWIKTNYSVLCKGLIHW